MRSVTARTALRLVDQRRLDRRYPLAAGIVYKVRLEGGGLCEGFGHSVNMSRRGILIASETNLPVGAMIELQVAWPAKLDHLVALNLHIRGYTVRSIGNQTAVAIKHHEFRTRRQFESATADSKGVARFVSAHVCCEGAGVGPATPESNPE